ncbi:MAG: aminopeptidase N [Alphaproteobacteria bacterium]
MPQDSQPSATHLADYTPPPFVVDEVAMDMDLDPDDTRVKARLAVRRGAGAAGLPLRLDGENMELLSIAIDGARLAPDAYRTDARGLTIDHVPDRFILETVSRIRPRANTRLEGLYMSGGGYVTQCEAEGFRHITWFPDRPDVLARFQVTLRAPREACPVLLANGNPSPPRDLPDGRHEIVWTDPFPKPAYLFAIVAGRFDLLQDTFRTHSGRDVSLRIYVAPGKAERAGHAMESLKRAMAWDESVYGLEYDLDIFMIVAVPDFNMGAMENKGLNIFNDKLILASPQTATDADYHRIEGVVAHEYFHNWTGNRVTLRDWFQLSLKEGLTVFRDQSYSADQGSATVQRIDDVRRLRALQFPEDAGPLAHPVRPETYIEISNFYTPTVYEKGAEVIRMIHRLLGPDQFRAGMDLYFRRHDGQAVTTEDFVAAMADASGVDLSAMRRWYGQAGTPRVTASGDWDARAGRYTLTIRQETLPVLGRPGQPANAPLPLPCAMGLVGPDGNDLPVQLDCENAARTDCLLTLDQASQTFTFVNLPARPVPSLFRGFSAPVQLDAGLSDDELAFLMAHDSDGFNRWEAGRTYMMRVLLALASAHGEESSAGPADVPPALIDACRRALADSGADTAFAAEVLTMPGEVEIGEAMDRVDPVAAWHARQALRQRLAADLAPELAAAWADHGGLAGRDPASVGRRALAVACLDLLSADDSPAIRQRLLHAFEAAPTMTESVAALTLLAAQSGEERRTALESFYRRWRDDPLVLDKWFTAQAVSPRPSALDEVRSLTEDAAFDRRNPNRVRALIGAFAARNPLRFHAGDGDGYAFLLAEILRLDPQNPQVAARLAEPLTRWRRHHPTRGRMMAAALERLRDSPGISADVFEVASRALQDDGLAGGQPH